MSKSFKALEVPDFTRKFVPKQHAGKLTEPEPFNLTTDSRHARYEAQLQAKKEAEAESREAAVITFIVTASGLSFYGVSGAFWGLVAGGAVLALTRWRRKS